MSDQSHVLRFPRSDEEGSFILAEVTPTGSGSKPLNLKIVATEGAAPYVISLRHDRVDKLKVKNCPCSQDEWEHILASILLDGQPVEDIEAAAAVQEEESVTITFRKRISGITQRLGALTLTHKEDEAIELYDWCGAAITVRNQIKLDLTKASARATELESAVNELKDQLEELIKTKEDDESVLLEKFRDLLNEKKIKIREQQRLMASGGGHASFSRPTRSKTPEIKEEKQSQATPPTKATSKPTRGGAKATKATRAPKRKAKAAEPSDGEDSDDGFEKMDVDQARKEDEQEPLDEDAQTTDADSRTESEPDEEDEDDAGSVSPPKASSTRAAKDTGASQSSSTSKPDEAPPPRRTLPFNNGKAPAKKPEPAKPAPAAAGGSDTDSDDEL